jgi:hypothetical protein
MNDALMDWDIPSLKTKTSSKPYIPGPQECVGTNKDRAYGTPPPAVVK